MGQEMADIIELGSCENGSITCTISDREVFDCPICYQALKVPVSQCINGHTICSSCLAKVNNKCPTCRSCVMFRSRVMDNVLEVIQVKCKNDKYGCQKTMSFSEKKDHEKTCHYAPVSCPLSDCNFLGSTSQLYQHFSWKHSKTVVPFTYNKRMKVTLNVNDSVLFFREEKNGHLFSLKNIVAGEIGNVISISPIGASQKKEFSYKLIVRSEKTYDTYKYKRSLGDGLDDNHFKEGCFFLEPELFGSNGQCMLAIYMSE